MIQRRATIMVYRCECRWTWRDTTFDYGIPRPLTEIKAPHIPESRIGEAVNKAGRIYWARKKPKKGTDIFKAAWYKSRGFCLV